MDIHVCYELGEGTPVDLKEALEWYQLAAKQGYVEAQKRIEAIEKPASSKFKGCFGNIFKKK